MEASRDAFAIDWLRPGRTCEQAKLQCLGSRAAACQRPCVGEVAKTGGVGMQVRVAASLTQHRPCGSWIGMSSCAGTAGD
ncbi:hypothetical protein L1887_59844 [Cichorium endivia]|nr:hypothetical protein L1887_59844 [Cichorium endivia]